MQKQGPVQQDINAELFTTFNPDEELWAAAGSKSPRGTIGRDGSGSDSDYDYDATGGDDTLEQVEDIS